MQATNNTHKSSIWTTIVPALLVLLVFNVQFIHYPALMDSGDPIHGLDPSWQMMLTHALKHKLVWGKDIVYTYGPLGFLETRVAYGISPILLLLFDCFVLFNLFSIFRRYIQQASNKWIAAALLTALGLVYTMDGSTPWLLLFFIFYRMRLVYDKGKTTDVALLIVTIVLCMYMKLNTGLVSIAVFVGFLVLMIVQKRVSLLKGGVWFAALSGSIFVTSLLLHVSLTDYIKGALEIVNGYVAIMSLPGSRYAVAEKKIDILFLLMCIAYLTVSIISIRKKRWDNIFFALVAILFLFLLRKQAITRNDWGHYLEFFSASSLVLFSGGVLPEGKAAKYVTAYTALYIMILVAFDARMRTPAPLVMSKIQSKKVYLSSFTLSAKDYHQADKRRLPLSVLNKMGNKTVDVFPWDAAFVLENKLNYAPRPVFQSFSAYTPYLAELNYQYYVQHAPEFVLYDYASIDDRYPFADDCMTQLILAENYKVADSFYSNGRQMLLLGRKNETIVPFSLSAIEVENLDADKPVATTNVSLVKIDLAINTKSKMLRMLNRAPQVYVQFYLSDGTKLKYKTSQKQLASGIYTAAYIDNIKSFHKFMEGTAVRSIDSVEILTDEKWKDKKMKITLFTKN
ncbi:MAG: hypothetical protein ACK4EY_06240 [Flavipsychrobacter sp.]